MTQERQLQYDQTYMNMAIVLSGLSYAKRNKVGCIIVSDDGQIISQGYNGMPHGMDNSCEIEHYVDNNICKSCDHEHCEGCKNIELITKPEVLHAESNAIAKCAKYLTSTDNATLYVTLSPCIDCTKQIIQCGIKRVVFHDEYRNIDGLMLLINSNIKVQRIMDIGNGRIALIDVDENYIKATHKK